MAGRFRWGIVGPGNIARKFGTGVLLSETSEVAVVGSRDLGRSETFCAEFGGRAVGSYDEVLGAEDVDGVYIATPHHLHAELTIAAAKAGKNVLCEKPCALRAEDAARAIEACQAAGVLFCEAYLYRTHPLTAQVMGVVHSGKLGVIRHIAAEFAFGAADDWQNVRTVLEYGGGGLMDVGVYPVSYAMMVFGGEPKRVSYLFEKSESGYDGWASGSMIFDGGRTVSFGCGIHVQMENRVRIYGTHGMLDVSRPWDCTEGFRVKSHGSDDWEEIEGIKADRFGNEVDVFVRSLDQGFVASMTPDDSLAVIRTHDRLRIYGGLDFPGDP
jgi:predicted dehydrogenase